MLLPAAADMGGISSGRRMYEVNLTYVIRLTAMLELLISKKENGGKKDET
jgi:hypothetical protein